MENSLSTSYHRGASACILTFDLNAPDTLHAVRGWYNQVKTHAEEPNIKWYLVGTKCDLVKHVDEVEVKQLAEELKAEYWEVSSKEGINVDKLFNRIAFVAWKDKLIKWNDSNTSTNTIPSKPKVDIQKPTQDGASQTNNSKCNC